MAPHAFSGTYQVVRTTREIYRTTVRVCNVRRPSDIDDVEETLATPRPSTLIALNNALDVPLPELIRQPSN